MIYMWGQQFILCRSAKREPWEAMAKSCLLFVFARVVEALDATCDSQAAYDFVFVG